MKSFQSYKNLFLDILPKCIATPPSHAKWLNTLSYLENCGAKKIAKSEHPSDVSKEMLKHASEEFRHAFYLKQQIGTKLGFTLPSYRRDFLWGEHCTVRYLDRLEAKICKLVKKEVKDIPTATLKKYAYLLVTYTIELRASELYPIYQKLLIEAKSPVSVRSILLEEKGHLEEMEKELTACRISEKIRSAACEIEGKLCKEWLESLRVQSSFEIAS